MKKSKKLLAFLLSVLTVALIACPVIAVNAATVKTISAGSYVKVTNSTKYYYKVTVKSEGYITLYGKGVKNNRYGYAYIELLNSKKKAFMNTYPSYINVDTYTDNTASIKYPVSAGTYYIHVRDVSSTGSFSVKYTFKAITQPANYCIAKAKALASGTVSTVYQTPGYNFERWYKITLKSNKKISVTTNESVDIFDNEGNRIPYDYSSGKYTTKSKMVAGTYYIRLDACYEIKKAKICTLKWA